MSFKVGDRVKIPKGVEGTVRFVGKVTFATGKHLGVELDEPAGDNNGKKKGKTYFSCKKKYGVIEKTGYFTAIKKGRKGSKRKSISSKGKKGGSRVSKAPANLSALVEEEKDSGKKGKKAKHKEASPAPKMITKSTGMQTEAPKEMLAYVESEYYCKIITRLYTEENEKLRTQRDEAVSKTLSLQQRTDAAEARAKQLEYEIKQQNVELDPLREQLEMKEVETEELTIKLEIANLEIEELQEKLEESLDAYVKDVSEDQSKQAELVAMNQELQTQLAQLSKVGQELMDSKDKRINSLATEADYVDSLSARLKDLLSVEQEVLGLKTEVQQLRDKNLVLEDADRMCQQLTAYINELEGELTDWREWVLDVEAERKILEELHENDELHIQEILKEKKDLGVQLFEVDKENKLFKIEKQDLQKEIFEIRNKMERQDLSAASNFQKYNFAPTNTNEDSTENEQKTDDFVVVPNPTDSGDNREQKNQDLLNNSGDKKLEAIWNENIKLNSQLEELKGIVMSSINESIEGRGHYVEYNLMKQYLPPHSSEVDYKGIAVLTLIHKILYKAKYSRDLLERFYSNPSSSLLQNPNLAMAAYTLCPMILTQENYIRAIQQGFLSVKADDLDTWKQKIMRFDTTKFKKILMTYNKLMECIQNVSTTNELNFDIDKLAEDEKVLKAYVDKQFVEFSPEKPKKDEYRCSKNIVLSNVSETHYRFQSLSIKLNQFNAKLFDLVHTPAQTTKVATNTSVISADEEDSKYEEKAEVNNSSDYTDDAEDILKVLKIGAVEKLFRLRNDVISSVQQVLKYCQPVELGYSKEKYALNIWMDGNKTAIKWGQLKACKHISFKSVQRVAAMLEKINENVKVYQLPKKRVELINKIIEEEEEQNEEGLISLLEKAYNIISDVRKIIGSTLHTTLRSTDEMAYREYDSFNLPFWEAKASNFRVLFEKQKETQDRMHAQENSIKESHVSVVTIRKELKTKEQMIAILTEQNVKEKDKSVRLAEVEVANNALQSKNEKYKAEIVHFTSKISAQNEEIAAKSAAIEKYKKAISRIKEKESPLGPKTSSNLGMPKASEANHAGVGGAMNARHGTLLVDNEVEYSSLLQQTIQSLRRRVTELTVHKKVINCEVSLKPLPFTLMRAKMIANLHQRIQKEKGKNKKKKRVKKKAKAVSEDSKEEKEDSESEYEWVTDTEAEMKAEKSELDLELERLRKEQKSETEMEQSLKGLSAKLNRIISQPMIVDLTQQKKKNHDLSQDLIGRQFQLRDVGLKYQKCKETLQKSQSANHGLRSEAKKQQELGEILGTIQIPNHVRHLYPSLKSMGYRNTLKVALPTQSFDKLQNSFLW